MRRHEARRWASVKKPFRDTAQFRDFRFRESPLSENFRRRLADHDNALGLDFLVGDFYLAGAWFSIHNPALLTPPLLVSTMPCGAVVARTAFRGTPGSRGAPNP
jgi:hypothetical protein